MQNATRPSVSFDQLAPPVVKNLLIVNGLVFLAQVVFDARSPEIHNAFERWFELWPVGGPEVIRFLDGTVRFGTFWPWQVVTMAFMHGGIGHIAFNLIGLFLFGRAVEEAVGSRRFALLFFASVVTASLLQLAFASWPFLMGAQAIPYPTLGASGGVLGVLVACALLFPTAEIFIIPFPVPIPIRWIALFYVAGDVLGLFGVGQPGIAHAAHLGGAAAGFLLVQYWRGRLPLRPRARLST